MKSTNHVASSHRVTHSDQNRFHIDSTLTKIGEKFTIIKLMLAGQKVLMSCNGTLRVTFDKKGGKDFFNHKKEDEDSSFGKNKKAKSFFE